MSGVPFAILRHASTAWNEERRLQGLTDTTLSPAGEAEARRWRLPPPADGWPRMSSPLQRARRTAELLRPAAASRTRSPGASSSRATAEAKACASPTGVNKPVTPSATTAGTPPVRPATTGRPAAWASRKAMPKASLIAGHR